MDMLLKKIDYSVLQQCMHCALCLPTCPTYLETKIEKNSPRGRISLMRAIADDRLPLTASFGQEMYYCLGCLACETACPAGVDYAHLFETARAATEQSGILDHPARHAFRWLTLGVLFQHPSLLRLTGRWLYFYRRSGLQTLLRQTGLFRFLPARLQNLEKQTPIVQAFFSDQLIRPVETPPTIRYRVGLLTGCLQDLLYAQINQDTVTVLLQHGCEVWTPRSQYCCGSLHVHNGELAQAQILARRNIDSFDLDKLDAIITNAAGCGSHLKHYNRLLSEDPDYAARAQIWSEKVRDIHEWILQIGLIPPTAPGLDRPVQRVTYHEACHLCHGQKITHQPREILRSLPGIELIELTEATWCCGSAGVYNLTQPATAAALQKRKIQHILQTQAQIVATGNPGCLFQISNGLPQTNHSLRVAHPISLLAEAYRSQPQLESDPNRRPQPGSKAKK